MPLQPRSVIELLEARIAPASTAFINLSMPVLAISDGSVIEGNSGTSQLTFTVSLSEAATVPVTLHYSTQDGTALARNDYASATDELLTFAPGETAKTLSVGILGDLGVEDHESFSVILSGATNAAITTGTGMATILNDDTVVNIGDAGSQLEGDFGSTEFSFPLSLEKASALPVTVTYQTAPSTAYPYSDSGTAFPYSNYRLIVREQITFAPGEITKTVIATVLGYKEVEPAETFFMRILNPLNATIGKADGLATILTDDTSISVENQDQLEGHSGLHQLFFEVKLAVASTLPVSVIYKTADGTAIGGRDYIAAGPSVLTFAPGETSKTVTIDVIGDKIAEKTETFSLLLSGAVNAVIEKSSALVSLFNDDVKLRGRHTATFEDGSGGLAEIKVSKGKLEVDDFILAPYAHGSRIQLVDFAGKTRFAGANLSIFGKYPNASAALRVIAIDAAGIDLGRVKIKGYLAGIDAGDAVTPQHGVRSLSVINFGRGEVPDQFLPAYDVQSHITGRLGMLKVVDVFQGAGVFVSGSIGAVKIQKDLDGGSIRSDGNISSFHAKKSILSNYMPFFTLSALGLGTTAKAIGSVHIKGQATQMQILAGYDSTGAAMNADASIGSIYVGSSWIRGNIIAGAVAGADGLFGTADDQPISRSTRIVAKIASIVIKGAVGTSGPGEFGEHFGIVAEEITAFKSHGIKLQLHAGPSNDLPGVLFGLVDELKVREVA